MGLGRMIQCQEDVNSRALISGTDSSERIGLHEYREGTRFRENGSVSVLPFSSPATSNRPGWDVASATAISQRRTLDNGQRCEGIRLPSILAGDTSGITKTSRTSRGGMGPSWQGATSPCSPTRSASLWRASGVFRRLSPDEYVHDLSRIEANGAGAARLHGKDHLDNAGIH